MRKPGATPKVIRSHRESSWAPKLEVVRVRRATKPSRASNTMATRISQAACCAVRSMFESMYWPILKIATTPHTPLPSVMSVGRSAMVFSRRGRRNPQRLLCSGDDGLSTLHLVL